MFSKGVVLIFLILGLSSSIAHAIPHQNRAQESDPCDDTSTPKKSAPVLVASPSASATTADKGADKSSSKKVSKTGNTAAGGKGNQTAATGSSKKGANPQGNGKNATATADKGNKGANPQGNGKNATAAADKGNKGAADPQGNGKNNAGTGNNNDNSLCLDQSVLSKGSQSDGLNNATAGTSASLTSNNNFIDFCKGQTITNGQQVKTGSCNPIPMGVIASAKNIPSSKYVFPKNLDTLKANTNFTMKLAMKNVQLGTFTNAEETYYSAPQQVNKQGNIIGHTHLVVEQVQSLSSTDPLDASKFAFFKGVDGPADADGTVSVVVAGGLPAGVFRFSTIGTSSNHAPFLVAVAQHGSMEDAVYATVNADGKAANAGNDPATGNNNNPKTAATGKADKKAGKAAATDGNKPANATTKGANDKGGKPAGKAKPRSFSLEYRKD